MFNNKYSRIVLIIVMVFSIYLFSFSTLLAEFGEVTAPRLEADFGGLQNQLEASSPGDWIGVYIAAVYRYGVGVAVFLAVVMIMAGGFIWLVSAGRPGQITVAQDFIKSALLGLLLALFSYVLLYTVNPELVALKSINPQKPPVVEEIGRNSVKCVCTTHFYGGAGVGSSGGGRVECSNGGTTESCDAKDASGSGYSTSCSLEDGVCPGTAAGGGGGGGGF